MTEKKRNKYWKKVNHTSSYSFVDKATVGELHPKWLSSSTLEFEIVWPKRA